ncbi:MAG: dephospho-CoA kinase [Pseudomonadota bacterium]
MTPPFRLGLTGSIGMGKSTTARMLRSRGLPVWDADAAVHRLYDRGGAAVGPVGALHPPAVSDGQVDRAVLKDWISGDDTALKRLEKVVHPLVAQDRTAFLASSDSDIAVLDIPLLFETGADASVHAIAVVSTDARTQKERVMARAGMTEALFYDILSRQTPDAEKRARADYIIPSDTLEGAEEAVDDMLNDIKRRLGDA